MGVVQKLCGCEEKIKKEDASLGKVKGERKKRRFGERMSRLAPLVVPQTCLNVVN